MCLIISVHTKQLIRFNNNFYYNGWLFLVSGHDSKEDANSCIQLMMWKINEDLKNSKKTAVALGRAESASMAPAVKSKKVC